jgi:hypothetical protein
MHHFVFQQVCNWIKWKHPHRPVRELMRKYFTQVGTLKWVFYGVNKEQKVYLFQIILVQIRRHSLIQNKNPFLSEDVDYFLKRE